jgi:hypothetical protein
VRVHGRRLPMIELSKADAAGTLPIRAIDVAHVRRARLPSSSFRGWLLDAAAHRGHPLDNHRVGREPDTAWAFKARVCSSAPSRTDRPVGRTSLVLYTRASKLVVTAQAKLDGARSSTHGWSIWTVPGSGLRHTSPVARQGELTQGCYQRLKTSHNAAAITAGLCFECTYWTALREASRSLPRSCCSPAICAVSSSGVPNSMQA